MADVEMEKIATTAERLLNDVARLSRDIARLMARIEPFDDEPRIVDPKPSVFPLQTPAAVLNALHAAAEAVVSCEYHMSKVRGVVDEIQSSAVSRAEMAPYIKPRAKG